MTASDTATGSAPVRLGVAFAAISASVFGFGTTFARLGYDGGVTPLTLIALRISVFVVVMGIGLKLLGRNMRLRPRALLATVWMAATLGMVSVGYQGAVAYIPVSLAALVFYTYPLVVAVIALVAGRDRITVLKATALLLAFAGLVLALGPSVAVLDWRGIALTVFASLGMALTLTFGGVATRGEDPLVMSVYTNAIMLAVLAIVAISAGELALPTTQLGVFGAAGSSLSYLLAYGCWYLALSMVRPVRLATLFNIEPLVTLIVAWLVLGEKLSPLQMLGAALVLLSITLAANSAGTREPR